MTAITGPAGGEPTPVRGLVAATLAIGGLVGATVVEAGVDALGAVFGLASLLHPAMTVVDNTPAANAAVARAAKVTGVLDPVLVIITPPTDGHTADGMAGNAT